jgi:RNA polymerase sigma-70 factor (ECF subfamily)
MSEADLSALRRGDEAAFLNLVNAHHSALLRLAQIYSPNREVAEESVQETWIAALRGIDGFAERATIRTWLCRILINIARRRAAAESKAMPFSSLEHEDGHQSVDPDRFLRTGQYVGHWRSAPDDWSTMPERSLLSLELQEVVGGVVAKLPANQATVITLRDIEGWDSEEVSGLLDITAAHQRVILHRARSKVRAALESYLAAGGARA